MIMLGIILNLFRDDALHGYRKRDTPNQFLGHLSNKSTRAFQIRPFNGGSGSHSITVYPQGQPDVTFPLAFADNPNVRGLEEPVSGWYLQGCEQAQYQWNNMKYVTEKCGQKHLDESSAYRRLPFGLESRFDGDDAVWAVRGYFMGPDIQHSPPYVVVLCSDSDVSKWLVDAITKSLKNYAGWYATRLPKVRVLEYMDIRRFKGNAGSREPQDDIASNPPAWSPGQFESAPTDDENVEQDDYQPALTLEHDFESLNITLEGDHPVISGQALSSWAQHHHRCGIRLNVRVGPDIIVHGTIGGVVKIGDRLYGLTLGHIFQSALDLVASARAGSHSSVHAGPGDGTFEATPEPHDPVPDLNKNLNATVERWRRDGWYSMSSDWALVDLPVLPNEADTWDDLNLVETTSGDFAPVLVDQEPLYGRAIVLAVPGCTYSLRGIFVGSDAVVHIPGGSDGSPYAVWVLRMERPWLIQKGDSGSWAFDAFTGDLLGILIAGCPALLEAYIIPARRVFDDIRNHRGSEVSLPKGYRQSQESRTELPVLVESFRDIQRRIIKIKENHTPANWPALKKAVETWKQKEIKIRSQLTPATHSYTRKKRLNWVNPENLLLERQDACRYLSHRTCRFDNTTEAFKWARATIQQSAFRRYDTLNKALRDHCISTYPIQIPEGNETLGLAEDEREPPIYGGDVLHAVWDYIVLNKGSFSLKLGENSIADKLFDLVSTFSCATGPGIWTSSADRMPRDRFSLHETLKDMRSDLQRGFDDAVWSSEIIINELGESYLSSLASMELDQRVVSSSSRQVHTQGS